MIASELLPAVKYSFIIPTYNRKALISNAINSVLFFIGNDKRYEVIIIDDGSTDGTFAALTEKYHAEISVGLMKIVKLDNNFGVVAARNQGAKLASGRWLLILDSDNEIISELKSEFEAILASVNYPVILFRCVDDSGVLIGQNNLEQVLHYRDALNGDFPEFFGVCDRVSFLSEYTKPDVVALRRFEAVAYFRTLKKERYFYISDLVMRRYSLHASDRLSSRQGVVKDANLLIVGHFILLKEHWAAMSLKRLCVSLGALAYYSWVLLACSIGGLVFRRS
jgi:glycosyltransferase involved in cell wall biosynthesis